MPSRDQAGHLLCQMCKAIKGATRLQNCRSLFLPKMKLVGKWNLLAYKRIIFGLHTQKEAIVTRVGRTRRFVTQDEIDRSSFIATGSPCSSLVIFLKAT